MHLFLKINNSMADNLDKLGGAASSALKYVNDTVTSIQKNFDPLKNARDTMKSLFDNKALAQTKPVNVEYTSSINTQPNDDAWKVRISCPALEKNRMLAPLATVNGGVTHLDKIVDGVIFPYMPTVAISYKANYSPQKLTHTNYTSYSYENSEIGEISIKGDFSVQNKSEGAYLLAVIYFFRTVTKMYYGGNSSHAGNPPPMVFLDGFGAQYLPHIPCVVTSFSHDLPADVDYMTIGDPGIGGNPGSQVHLPTLSSISITLLPVYSRTSVYTDFNLNNFSNGDLLGKGFI